jgi:Trk K+ transport system NAD-binding subunit
MSGARRRRFSPRYAEASPTIFLLLRRMRAPLIVLIVIFSVSVLGLSLIPGQDAAGRPTRMSVFDAFYFMSYTATTIGYGELPAPFTGAQRLWVTASIYLTVIGWAYAIGSLLALLQDRALRQAIALRRFSRTVRRLREPFLLLAGYGQTGRILGRALDSLGHRMVVLDLQAERVDALDIDAYHADVPGLVGDAADPRTLDLAGLAHPCCEGVLALTDNDEVNLVVTMTAALLRPGLPVVARTVSPAIEHRMRAFGSPSVVNPFDRFGDHLRLALHAPASHQLLSWLVGGPGAELPEPSRVPATGRWVVCGYGRFGRKVVEDLRADGLDVTIIDLAEQHDDEHRDEHGDERGDEPAIIVGDASDPAVLRRARPAEAVGFVAGTDNDTTNLSLVAAARRLNSGLFVAARQNRPASAPLFEAADVDWVVVPAEVAAREIYAQLSTPLLWRFLREMPGRGDAWAQRLLGRLQAHCGSRLGSVWKATLTGAEAPALGHWLRRGDARLGDLLRSPRDRDQPVAAVPLMVLRGDDAVLGPEDDERLAEGDQILFVGSPASRRALTDTMINHTVSEYVLYDRTVPAGWLWQRATGRFPHAG